MAVCAYETFIEKRHVSETILFKFAHIMKLVFRLSGGQQRANKLWTPAFSSFRLKYEYYCGVFDRAITAGTVRGAMCVIMIIFAAMYTDMMLDKKHLFLKFYQLSNI